MFSCLETAEENKCSLRPKNISIPYLVWLVVDQTKQRARYIAQVGAGLSSEDDGPPNFWFDTFVKDMVTKRQDCSDLLKSGSFNALAEDITPNLTLSSKTDEWPGHSRDHELTKPLVIERYRKENIANFRESCSHITTRKMTVQGANEVWFDQMFTVQDYIYELDVAADLIFIGVQLRNHFTKIREGSSEGENNKSIFDSDCNQLFSMTSTPDLFQQFVVAKRLIMGCLWTSG